MICEPVFIISGLRLPGVHDWFIEKNIFVHSLFIISGRPGVNRSLRDCERIVNAGLRALGVGFTANKREGQALSNFGDTLVSTSQICSSLLALSPAVERSSYTPSVISLFAVLIITAYFILFILLYDFV